MPVTVDDVRDAIRRLRAKGERPTNQNIRAILGYGSFEKLAPLVRQALEEEAQAEASLRQAPPALRARFEGCLAELWATAQQMARDEAERIRCGAEAEAKEARREADASAAEVESLNAKLSEATLRLTDRTAEVAAAREAERAALLSEADARRRAAALETTVLEAEARADNLEIRLLQSNERVDSLIRAIPTSLAPSEPYLAPAPMTPFDPTRP